jgi:hypothetical protein
MPPANAGSETRVRRYAQSRGVQLIRSLGAGYDGSVFETNNGTAVKLFQFAELYERERDVYLRLFEREMFEVCGCHIPRLVDYDNSLWVIEMEIVQPPFVLDFAGAYLDRRPVYPPDVLEEWEAEKIEQYGGDWPTVRLIMAKLAGIGIYLADVKPGNITFR